MIDDDQQEQSLLLRVLNEPDPEKRRLIIQDALDELEETLDDFKPDPEAFH